MRKTDSRQSLLHFSPSRSPEASPPLPERLNLEGRGAAGGFATTLRINTDGDTLLPPRDPRSDDSIELGGMLLFAPPKASRLPPLAALSKSTPNLPRVTSNGSVVDIGEASPSNASDDPPPRAAALCGPGLAMAAAFVGPGTISTCAAAGAQFGFGLLWAVTFAVGGCIILQEASARVGLVTRRGLGEAIRDLRPKWLRTTIIVLASSSLTVGNASLQAGNVSGAGIGLRLLLGAPAENAHLCSLLAGGVVCLLLALGGTGGLTRLLGVVVLAMSALFVGTAAASGASFLDVAPALFTPSVPDGGGALVLALVGTTICSYNLFLQSSAVAQTAERGGHRRDPPSVRAQLWWTRADTAGSAVVGGMISVSILVTAAALAERGAAADCIAGHACTADGVAALAAGVAASFGPVASGCFSAGLLAAGVSSALAAPLATRYALCGLLGWEPHSWAAACSWALVAGGGALAASLPALNPLAIILFAQVANALLLPLLAGALLLVAGSETMMGEFRSGPVLRALGGGVVAVTLALSLHTLVKAAVFAHT